MHNIQSTKKFILDLIFPRFCVGCHKEGTWLCPDCESKIILIKTPTCCHCDRLAEQGICPKCRKKIPLTGSLSAGYYRDPILKQAIHVLKYENVKEIAEPLSKLLINSLRQNIWPNQCVLMPVPLHYWREKSRGFNQSELIARETSRQTYWPIITNSLKRIKSTKPQVGLKSNARTENVKGAFKITNAQSLRGKTVILVDDVITTGSTVGECARVLKKSGIKKVWAISIAKG